MAEGRDGETPEGGEGPEESDFTPPPPPLVPTSTGGWTLTDSGIIPEVPPEPEAEPAEAEEPDAPHDAAVPQEPVAEASEPQTAAFEWNLDGDGDPSLASSLGAGVAGSLARSSELHRAELLHVPTYEPTEILDTADATALQQPATRAERRRADAAAALTGPARASAPPSRGTRILIGLAIGLVALLALIGLFVLGTRLPAILAAPTPTPTATPTHSTTPTPTPTPTPTVMPKPTVAQSPGVHEWNTLGGGECLQPYTTPWAETFTVVDCGTPHSGQMVYTNLLSADPAAAYPGADAIAKQINILCTKPGIVNLAAAGAYPDLQLQGSYPATAAQWADGDHSYFCFASRSSAKPMTASVAGKGPAG